MTAARRSGGVPPSHSHCSATHGQMRLGDGAGELRRGLGDVREAQRAPGADADLVRADAPAAADRLGADDGDRDDGRAGLQREAADAALAARRARRAACACPRGR